MTKTLFDFATNEFSTDDKILKVESALKILEFQGFLKFTTVQGSYIINNYGIDLQNYVSEHNGLYVKIETLKAGNISITKTPLSWDHQFIVNTSSVPVINTIINSRIYADQRINSKVNRKYNCFIKNDYLDLNINHIKIVKGTFPYFSLNKDDFRFIFKSLPINWSLNKKPKTSTFTDEMIKRFPYKFVPPKGMDVYNRNYLIGNSVYSYLIYSDISKVTYVSFLKENRKLIGASTINTDHYDHKIATTYYNDLFKYHRIKFKISGKHHDIKKIIFNINNFQGKPYDLILN